MDSKEKEAYKKVLRKIKSTKLPKGWSRDWRFTKEDAWGKVN
jgi:hypothetical protein